MRNVSAIVAAQYFERIPCRNAAVTQHATRINTPEYSNYAPTQVTARQHLVAHHAFSLAGLIVLQSTERLPAKHDSPIQAWVVDSLEVARGALF